MKCHIAMSQCMKSIVLGLILLSSPSIAFAKPVQVWHTISGNCVTGTLEKVEGTVVHLLVNGKPVHIQAEKLSLEDRITALMAQYIHYDSDEKPIGLECDAPEVARKAYFAWCVRGAESSGKHWFKFAPMGRPCKLPDIPDSVLDLGVLKATFYDELNNPRERWFLVRRRGDVRQLKDGTYESEFWDDESHYSDVYFGKDVVSEIYALPEHSMENGHGPWFFFVKGKLGTIKNEYGSERTGIIVGQLQASTPAIQIPDAVREKLETMTEANWQAVRDELLGR